VKDLRSRWNALIVLFAIGAMLGCSALEGGPRTIPGSTSLVASSPTVNFGTVVVGNSTAFTEFIFNPTTASVTITGATVAGGDFEITAPTFPITILPGRRAALTLKFTPQSSGNLSGTILISNSAPQSSMTLIVSGRAIPAGQLVVTPSSISFGSVQLGKNQSRAGTLTNSGATNVTISQVSASASDFAVSGLSLPLTLLPNQTTNFNVVFAPQSSGTRTGSISVTGAAAMTNSAFRFRGRFGLTPQATSANGGQTVTISVAGVGAQAPATSAGQLVAAPTSLSFGSSQVGSSQSKPLVISNSGNVSTTVSQAAATGTGYTLSGPSLPLTLAPGQTATFTVTFAPQSAGAGVGVGNVAVVSDASNSTLNVALSATVASPGVLAAASNPVAFGTVLVGTSQQLPATITNSGGSTVTVNQAAVTGTGFSMNPMSTPMTLAPSQSSNITITCSPKSAGALSGSLTVSSTASDPGLTVALTGTAVTAGALTVSPSSFSFGSVQTSSNQSLPATLTNSGGSSVTVTQATAGAGYSITGLTLPLTLQAGQSQPFNVVFAPASAGPANSNLTITSNASNTTLTALLSGTGVTAGALTVSPSSFSFGSVQTGSNQSLPATLTNSGGSSVTVTQASFSGAGYSLTGLTLPLTLQAGQSQPFNVVFAPQSVGTDNFNLTITSNASNPTLTAPVSGSAVSAGSLTASAPSLSFGSVQVNSSQSLPETLTNSGGSSVTITQVAAGGGYSVSGLNLPVTLAAGKSTSFNVVFAPVSSGSSNVSLAITSNASSPTFTILLSGTGVAAGTLTASSVSFGNVQVGSSTSKTATITNSGGSTVTISQANLPSGDFTMSGLTTPLTLTAGQSFTFGVTFTPQAAGSASASIALVSTASSSPSISLSGTGVAAGQFAVSPSTLSFGSVTVGASKNLTSTISATGASVTVSSASVSTSEFKMAGPSLPMTIPAGGTATFTVTFTPQGSGAASANATFVTNAANSPAVEALTGTGTAAPQHSVSLSWSPSTSSVAGYNVYRGGTTGGPYTKINPATDTGTSYNDTSVQAGQTYFYVTTAVAGDGTESAFSNEVRAAIPTP
jgi:Abnormal spindle-like microcephaly-assoc'd, ASPM-SPD-2-Hydin/Cep192 domain 4